MVAGLSIGDAGTPSEWQVTNSFIYQDTIARTAGRHNLRFGAEFRRHEVDVDSPNETDGLLQIPSFDDFLLGQSAAQNGSPFGSAMSVQRSRRRYFSPNVRFTDFAGFAQDDVKLTRRLTVNAGLRMRSLAHRRRPAAGWRTSTRTLPCRDRFRPPEHSTGLQCLRTFRARYRRA